MGVMWWRGGRAERKRERRRERGRKGASSRLFAHVRVLRHDMYMYRVTSLIRKCNPLGPYRRTMPKVIGGFQGGGRFLGSEVPLYTLPGSISTYAVPFPAG